MRILVLITATLLLYQGEVHGQSTEATDIYLISLKEHLVWAAKNRTTLQTVYVEKNEHTTESLPASVSGMEITYLTKTEILDKTRNGRRIFLLVIRPVEVKSEYLKISVIDFSVTSRKKTLKYANGGGSVFEFRYNCDRGVFELTNKRQSGI